MNTPLSDEEVDRLARKRAGAKMGWYWHAAVYAVVNGFLFLGSSMVWGSRQWSVYPMLGWGLGLALHGLSVFVLGSEGGMRDRMVQKERERILRDRNNRTP